MSESIRRWLVAYDIPDDQRRCRVATVLSSIGDRVQYSVFVVDGRPAQFVRLRSALMSIVDQHRDSLLLIDLGLRDTLTAGRFERVGVTRRLWSEEDSIV